MTLFILALTSDELYYLTHLVGQTTGQDDDALHLSTAVGRSVYEKLAELKYPEVKC